MSKLKTFFLILPWLLLLVALLLWSLGVDLSKIGSSKTEIAESTVILEKIERLGRLELVRYNFKEIYDYRSLSEGKLTGSTLLKTYDFKPDIKAVLIAKGEAVGCIDLAKISADDLQVGEDTLFVELPSPELCYHKLDLENTRVYNLERSGWWSRLFSDDEEIKKVVEKAYKNAELQIKKTALESGILAQTEENAYLILKPMLEKMSGKVVVLNFSLGGQTIKPK